MTGKQSLVDNNISTLVDLARFRRNSDPEKICYIFLQDGEHEEDKISYFDFEKKVRARAAILQKKVSPGDRAILLYPAGLEFILAFFSCLYAGIVAVPTYPPNFTKISRSMPRLLSILSDAKPKLILSTLETIDLLEPIIKDHGEIKDIAWLATEKTPNDEAENWIMPDISKDSLAFLQYTSGSTSTPKGVMVSHGNVLYNSKMIREAFQNSAADIMFSWLPAYHDMGLIGGIIHPMYLGATGVLMSPLHFLQRPFRWLQAISRYKVTVSGSPNFGYEWCLKRVKSSQHESLDLSSWRLAYNGAEPVRSETLRTFYDTFADCGFQSEAFYPCYGLAEATLFVSGGYAAESPSMIRINRDELLKNYQKYDSGGERMTDFVSCGFSWLDQGIAIVDPETRQECETGKVGEVWISGPNIAQGYWRNSQATGETFNAFIDNANRGPYMRTGDLGFIQDGELYIASRLKDLIIIDGLNHYPQDIEATVEKSHPGIREGFAVAFSIEYQGDERLVIVAEFRQRYKESVEEARVAIRKAVAQDHDLPVHDIVFIQMRTLSKTASGKHQRHLCKSEYLSDQLTLFERG